MNRSESDETGSLRPVVLLGGSGFIGTRLANLLIAKQIPMRIGDLRLSEKYPEHSTRCDVRKLETIKELLTGAGTIVNLAAVHRDDVRPVSLYDEVNVEGARQVCQAARIAGIKKIVFTGSVAVYGFQPNPVDESGPFDPFNEYGRTKLEAESVYRAWADEEPARTLVIIRPTVVFGEGNRGNVYNLLNQIASGRFLMVGSGENIKSMAYVGNVAAFLLHMLSMGPGTQIINYVDGPDMKTRELVAHVKRCLGKPTSTPELSLPIALAVGHLLDTIARLTGRSFPVSAVRIRKFTESTQFRADRVAQTGFNPPYTLAEGLARTLAYEFRKGSPLR